MQDTIEHNNCMEGNSAAPSARLYGSLGCLWVIIERKYRQRYQNDTSIDVTENGANIVCNQPGTHC